MEKLLTFILVHYAFLIIAYKYNVKAKIQWLGEKIGLKILWLISECEFCIGHWVGWIVLTPLILINGFEWVHLIYPLMSISFIFMVKRNL